MKVTMLAALGVTFQLLLGAQAYLSTVSVTLSYCPAPSPTLATGSIASTPTSSPIVSYFLYILSATSAQLEYVSVSGAISPNISQADNFTLSSTGQLISGGSMFSTSGLEPSEVFTPQSYVAAISTGFSINNGVLMWASNSFVGDQALFCTIGSTLEVVYNGVLPDGCIQTVIYLKATFSISTTISITPASTFLPSGSMVISGSVAVSSTTTPFATGSVQGELAVGNPIGCLTSSPTSPALSGVNETTATLEQCVDFCATYSYFGVQYGNLCICGNSLATNASPATYGTCNLPCNGNGGELCGGVQGIAIYTVVARGDAASSYSTTPIPSSLDSTSLSPSPTSTDALSSTVSSSSLPPIRSSNMSLPTTSIMDLGLTSSGSTSSGMYAPSSTPVPITSMSAITSISFSSMITSQPASSTVNPTFSLSSSSISTTTGCGITPTDTLCPSYSQTTVSQGASCYDIECTASLQGSVLTGNISTAASLSDCIGFCNLYNFAVPNGCVGVNYFNSVQSSNCLLLSSISGLVYSTGTDSGSLIYAGYRSYEVSSAPTPSSFIVSSTISSTSSSSSLATSTSSTSSSSSSSSSTSLSGSISSGPSTNYNSSSLFSTPTSSSNSTTSISPTCTQSYAAGPTQGSLCPTYAGDGLSYDSYGVTENYEIECDTAFTGIARPPGVSFDLPDCIKSCQYDNVNIPNTCVAVHFNGTVQTRPLQNNCFQFSSVTHITRNSTAFDGARLLYSAYQCPVDYNPGYSLLSALPFSSTSSFAPSSTAPPTTSNAGLALSTDYPNAYPQDPVCNNDLQSTYEGSQLISNQGTIYDIECMTDYRNPVSNLPNPAYVTTYDACADACDNSTKSGIICFAFTWIPGLMPSNCFLMNDLITGLVGTTNLTQTSGVHSGRWLLSNSVPPVGATNAIYLKNPIPFPCSGNQNNPALPVYPGGTNTYFNGWAYNAHTTVLDLSGQYGIQFQIFDQVANTISVNANGWLTNTPLSLTAASQPTWSLGGRNNDIAPETFPATNLPTYTLSPFWTSGFILQTTQQGIYYQVDTISSGRYGISIEFFFSHYTQDDNVYHWITTYDTGVPGTWEHYMFSTGTVLLDDGLRQSVGAQGSLTNTSQVLNYEAGEARTVQEGNVITMVTGAMPYQISEATIFAPEDVPYGSWTWFTKPT